MDYSNIFILPLKRWYCDFTNLRHIKTLQETENGLWAESAEYISDRYYEESQSSHN